MSCTPDLTPCLPHAERLSYTHHMIPMLAAWQSHTDATAYAFFAALKKAVVVHRSGTGNGQQHALWRMRLLLPTAAQCSGTLLSWRLSYSHVRTRWTLMQCVCVYVLLCAHMRTTCAFAYISLMLGLNHEGHTAFCLLWAAPGLTGSCMVWDQKSSLGKYDS